MRWVRTSWLASRRVLSTASHSASTVIALRFDSLEEHNLSGHASNTWEKTRAYRNDSARKVTHRREDHYGQILAVGLASHRTESLVATAGFSFMQLISCEGQTLCTSAMLADVHMKLNAVSVTGRGGPYRSATFFSKSAHRWQYGWQVEIHLKKDNWYLFLLVDESNARP
jgi:hypothetical protein